MHRLSLVGFGASGVGNDEVAGWEGDGDEEVGWGVGCSGSQTTGVVLIGLGESDPKVMIETNTVMLIREIETAVFNVFM